MSQYYSSQVNNLEGFQILVRATEIASGFLKMAQEDKRLKLNFLLAADVSCTEALPNKTNSMTTVASSFGGRNNCIPVQRLESRVSERCSPVHNPNRQEMLSGNDLLMPGIPKKSEPVKDNSLKNDMKREQNRPPPLHITNTTYYASGMNNSGLNSSLEYWMGNQAMHCFSELSSANSLLSLEGSSRQVISRRGRRKSNPSLSDEQRRKLRTLRNREAAERARIRKRERERLLEEELSRVLNENRRLEKELLWLKEIRASSCL
ncbi:hypothetical protein GpartN1_g4463.t1 [Galdieria partita]|uniref:BZIP domain-containing protein n=1 Tax=Galdieria partita TaxID=83374 RepID=A0A9C7Q027_9RHOD|nr:hypothetical protein GpartN1_g4463.t1 [Galdieria partita]